MYQTIKTYIKPDIKMAGLIFENPYLILLLEHFELDLVMHERTVSQLCIENGINEKIFISFANLYNGFAPTGNDDFDFKDIGTMIRFLQNSHYYFQHDKYPEIQDYIKKLFEKNPKPEIKMIEKFFDDYFLEVTEHFDYEEEIAFPYFYNLLMSKESGSKRLKTKFTAKEYLEHHTDIESKLTDLKNLLLRHISLKNDPVNRRKLLFSLIELEYILNIHSIIEETILIPLVINLENKQIVD
jgi:regulator of cell morphogenesis and NO signaling